MEGERDADFLERIMATNRRLKKEKYDLEISIAVQKSVRESKMFRMNVFDEAKDALRHDYNAWNDAERQIRVSDNSLMETATVMAMHPTDWPMRLWEQDVDDYMPPSDIDSEDTEELKDMLNDLKELSAEADSIQDADITNEPKDISQNAFGVPAKSLSSKLGPCSLSRLRNEGSASWRSDTCLP